MTIMSLAQVRLLASKQWMLKADTDALCATVEELAMALRASRSRMAAAKDAHNAEIDDVEMAHRDYGRAAIDNLLAQLDAKELPSRTREIYTTGDE